jgi:cobalt/nickel transport system permease protein
VGAFLKFGLIFVVTQIPLAVAEGILTALIMNALTAHIAAELRLLKILPGEREGT